ncbi:carotenoid biosynthesis protein [Ktedonospora formicarum]|uniref:Carotenoid biosynthesis protein n=1 Tax=Ktedonospora formicarum TaxID=2778364 RepID=A0A8J3HYG7_9CHLR|nr:carotenoid biosynthesis protein [Ktedonospora formicarum]GHO43440.1 hypothetical protein KSX_16030 [Ktedonospora formicarum]
MRLSLKRRGWRRPVSPHIRLLRLLFGIFCLLYALAVIGVGFDVKPPFSMDWAASLLLYLEGILILMAAALVYSMRRALGAGFIVLVLSFLVETLGVNTGFPFGHYSYTSILFPTLPGGVPLPVLFAWVTIILGVYSWFRSRRPGLRLSTVDVLLAGLAVMLLDGAIEPVAARITGYWRWVYDASFFYHIPLQNFAGWFVLGTFCIWLVDRQFAPVPRPRIEPPRMAFWLPRLLFACSLFMFGIVDLTHGYYGGVICAFLSALLLAFYARRR